MEIELVHRNKFEEFHRMIAALPSEVIFNRKALHFLWMFREWFGEMAFADGVVNRGAA